MRARQLRTVDRVVLLFAIGMALLPVISLQDSQTDPAVKIEPGVYRKSNIKDTPSSLAASQAAGNAATRISAFYDHYKSRNDHKTYQDIFALQAAGEIEKADKKIASLKDRSLMGHVLFQRYMHPTAYRSTFKELQNWLKKYHDHPEASRIYRLAKMRRPESGGSLVKPSAASVQMGLNAHLMGQRKIHIPSRKRSKAQTKDINELIVNIDKNLDRGRVTVAYTLLNNAQSKRHLDRVEFDMLVARIAAGYFHAGKYEKARKLALESEGRSGDKIPLAAWIGGLTTWRSGEFKTSARLFAVAANSDYAGPWTRSAAAYWAWRSYAKAGDQGNARIYLEKAAQYPRTFYGLLANRALGRQPDFNWSTPVWSETHARYLAKHAAASRAMHLISAGQTHLAEAELRQVNVYEDPALKEAILALVSYANLPMMAMRMGEAFTDEQSQLYDRALYPLGNWGAEAINSEDRALIHAIIRQESRFESDAVSYLGATGLMQLMPRTASFISGDNRYLKKEARPLLMRPRDNLGIGRKYVHHLFKLDRVERRLFDMLIAYNAGPGNLGKWQRKFKEVRDPLLFIESIPSTETRAFIERVMANYWIYKNQLGEDDTTMDQIIAGQSPVYPSVSSDMRVALER